MLAVSRLTHHEVVEVDQSRLQLLVRERGMRAAENILTRAMEDMATRLSRLEPAYAEGRFDILGKEGRALAASARQTGLLSVERAATDLSELHSGSDATALAAVLCRLLRVSEMSFVTVWDVHDVMK